MEIIKNPTSNYFTVSEVSKINGYEEATEFFDSTFEQLILSFKSYYKSQPENEKEFGFEYGEQQTKTYLTIALGNVTSGNLIQEYPLNRKYYEQKLFRIKEVNYRGRLDY